MSYSREYVFQDGGVTSCHASTLLNLKSGQFLLACFDGSEEGKEDVGIRLMQGHQGGHWTGQRIKIRNEAHWNPVLFRLPSNSEIALYFKVGQQISNWKTYVCYSSDEGASWSFPEELVLNDYSGGRGPVKNKPILLHNGVIAAPASLERKRWSAFVDLSRDNGKTWVRSAAVPMADQNSCEAKSENSLLGAIQPTLWESVPGTVHMLLRSNNHRIYRSDSLDGGLTWCNIYPTELPNNNSGIDLVKLTDGTLLLLCNPNPGNMGPRRKLSLFLSNDNGHSWIWQRDIENETNEQNPAEYSYPAIIAFENNQIALSYTVHRRNIAFLKGQTRDFLS